MKSYSRSKPKSSMPKTRITIGITGNTTSACCRKNEGFFFFVLFCFFKGNSVEREPYFVLRSRAKTLYEYKCILLFLPCHFLTFFKIELNALSENKPIECMFCQNLTGAILATLCKGKLRLNRCQGSN